MNGVENNPRFRITGNKGFQITFSNQVTVSVQFGPGNYCQNYTKIFAPGGSIGGTGESEESSDAEIAIWDGAD
jgi:hypothetical protein